MHIHDGVLDPVVVIGAGAAAVGAVTYAGWTMRHGHLRLGWALAGAGGVLIAHLLDVPLDTAGALTGHVIGGTLLAIVLGPSLALLTMTAALATEALLWGDGGVLALGVNVLVMGVAGIAVGWSVWRWLGVRGDRWRVPAAGLAGFASVLASSAALWAAFALGAPGAASVVLWHHVAWAALEGAVTAIAVALVVAWQAHRARLLNHADALGLGHRHQAVVDGDLEALGYVDEPRRTTA
ncbi:energy-coupling factor ABC transporter permease [Demequina iriomotensis]|uniref:energy-coupling factor ABC transporter permease n=1 Tax=Demequina iriomotensis TaxID=1536641 RepID=UPI00078675C2|nr:energy-coupling factor ABC transporter permease [Demequina iriomotensis]